MAVRFASLFFNFAGVFVASYRLIGKSTREEVLFLSGTVFQVLRCENLWICFIMKGIVGGILTFKKTKKNIPEDDMRSTETSKSQFVFV